MAKPPRSEADPNLDSIIATILAEKMPGFEIAPELQPPPPEQECSVRREHGPSYSQLRKRFGAGGDDANDAVKIFKDAKPSRVTKRVVSRDGRSFRVVDIDTDKGTVTIVSG